MEIIKQILNLKHEIDVYKLVVDSRDATIIHWKNKYITLKRGDEYE